MPLLTIQALVRDLKIDPEELLSVITKPEELGIEGEDELPSTASDVPLSRTGSLYLLATMAASSTFFDAPSSLPSLHIVPEYAAILGSSLGDSSTGSTGAEPEPLIDAVLYFGFLIVNDRPRVTSDDDQVYNNILQRLSLLSANMPSPVLRYHAHLLTSTLLHLHPEDHFRLAFIRDTLEHCPFENLKASAVGWLKDELLAADGPTHKKSQDSEPSIFTTSAVLETLQPYLFVDLDTLMEGQSASDSYSTFQAHQAFYLAVLNLLFLLVSSSTLSTRLEILGANRQDPQHLTRFLKPLTGASRRFRTSILSDELDYSDDDTGKETALAGLELVDMSVQQVEDAIARLQER